MFELSVRDDFSAAHRLRGYPGKCENLHGHNWTVEVVVRAESLNEIGVTIDFGEVKAALTTVLADLDHKSLNEIEPFDKQNPSSENIARYVYGKLREALDSPGIKVRKVRVYETPEASASYWEEE
jgi:6-pyruvoyltetrahydropterin/6-carboxytetrahydropterin synthase